MAIPFKVDVNKDLSSIVDIEKLKASNDLLHKWIKILKIPQNKFTVFVSDIRKNYDTYLAKVPNDCKAEFAKDYKNMFYAGEVENALVEQFYPMILRIIKQVKETNPEYVDEMLYHGLMAIRNSVWKYRNHESKASFFTYVFNGAFYRVKGTKYKLRKAFLVNQEQNKAHNETDFFNDKNRRFGLSNIADEKTKSPDELPEEKIDMQKMFKKAQLSKIDIQLMKLYITRDSRSKDWSKKFRMQHSSEDGKIYSRQAVDNRLMIAKYKLWKVMHKEFGMEFRDKSMPFVKRYMKVRKKLV